MWRQWRQGGGLSIGDWLNLPLMLLAKFNAIDLTYSTWDYIRTKDSDWSKLTTTQTELIRQVEKTDLIVEAISKGFKQMGRDIEKVGKDIDKTDKAMESASKSGKKQEGVLKKLKENWMLVAGGVVAAKAAIETVKKVWEFGKEGAQIEKVRDTFDSLTTSIGETSEAILIKMRDATAGMVADTDLIMAANRNISMGLAQTGDEAANLAKIAVTLGGAMGKDATMAMEEFSLMLANQSIPRLDTFGISAGKVKTRIKELRDENKDMTRETAFMTAVMEQAEVSMKRLGDEIPVDGFTQFEVQVKNLTDDLKVLIAEGLGPAAAAMAQNASAVAVYRQAQNDVVIGNKLANQVWADVRAAQIDAADKTAVLTKAFELLKSGIAETSEEAVEWAIAAEKADQAGEHLADAYVRVYGDEKRTSDATEELNDKLQQQANLLSEAATETAKWRVETNKGADATELFTRRQIDAIQASRTGIGVLYDLAGGYEEVAGAADDVVRSFDAIVGDSLKFLNEDLDELGPKMVLAGGRTADQNKVLEEATRNYERTQEALGKYATGLRGYGMEADEVAERQADLAAEGEYWLGIIGEMSQIQGEASMVMVEATSDLDEMNKALFEAVGATENLRDSEEETKTATLELGIALGQLTEDEAAAIVKAWALAAAVEDVRAAFEKQDVTAEQAAEALQLVAAGEYATAQEAIDAIVEVDNLHDSLDEMAGDYEAHVKVDVDDSELDRAISKMNHLRTMAHLTPGQDTGDSGGGSSTTTSTTTTSTTDYPKPDAEYQHGGYAFGGRAYLVGEAGPELFIPGTSGHVISNQQMSNAFNFNISGGDETL
jgi:hypothetical protein